MNQRQTIIREAGDSVWSRFMAALLVDTFLHELIRILINKSLENRQKQNLKIQP